MEMEVSIIKCPRKWIWFFFTFICYSWRQTCVKNFLLCFGKFMIYGYDLSSITCLHFPLYWQVVAKLKCWVVLWFLLSYCLLYRCIILFSETMTKKNDICYRWPWYASLVILPIFNGRKKTWIVGFLQEYVLVFLIDMHTISYFHLRWNQNAQI